MYFLRSLAALLFLAAPAVIEIRPAVATDSAGDDADDPAVWIHPVDVSRSLILATNKAAAPNGAVVVYGMDGKIRQLVGGIDRPNNIDVESDLAVVTERNKNRLLLFQIAASGIRQTGAVVVFEGQSGRAAAPMGIALYKRPRDGALFAIVSRKEGPAKGYLWQYRISGGSGVKVREFGNYGGATPNGNEIEAIAVDDRNGFVYYSDEGCCIRKWHADPDHPQAAKEIATFGRDGFRGNREGIAIQDDFIVVTDQIPQSSRYHLFRRTGSQGSAIAILNSPADSTDGIEVVSRPMGPSFPHGVLIAMNSAGKNFLLFPWPKME